MARIWVGPYVWVDGAWDLPTGAVRGIDLRSLAQCAAPGPSAQGNGLFVTPDAVALGANYVEVPLNFTGGTRNAVRNKLGLPQTIIAAGRRGFVLELLTRHAVAHIDVDGALPFHFCPPLLPNRLGRLRLRLADDGIDEDHEIRTDSPFWAKVQAMLHLQYRRYRAAAIAGQLPADFHRRWLTVQLEKFAGRITDWHAFKPADLPDEEPLPHSTTLTESFDTADADTLGPDQSWTEVSGDWDVIDNGVSEVGGGGDGASARVEADLAGDDHYAQIEIVAFAGNRRFGPAARFNAAENTLYVAAGNANNNTTRLYKYVGGTATNMASLSSTFSIPDTLRIEVNGSTIEAFLNGASIGSTTDTAITGNTRCGLAGGFLSAGVRGDAWEAGDLGGGGGDTTLACSISGAAAVTTALLTSITMAASLAAAATTQAQLATDTRLQASIAAAATVQPALATDIRLAASLAAAGAAMPALSTDIRFAATLDAAGTTTADLDTDSPLASSISGAASITSALTTDIHLAASLDGAASATAALTTDIPLHTSCTAAGTLAATLADVDVAASLVAAGTCAGALETDVRLATAMTAAAAAAADLSTDLQLAAAITGSASTSAALSTDVRLQTSLSCTATIAANLEGAAPMISILELPAEYAPVLAVDARYAPAVDLAAEYRSTLDLSAEME